MTPSSSGRIFLRGSGRSTILKAGSNNMYVIRLSDSNCGIEHLTIDGNSKTSVYGVGLVPENIVINTTTVYQTFNVIYDLFLTGLTEGFIFRSGLPISAVDSGCWYNIISACEINFCNRGIWLAGTSGHSGGNTRNSFNDIRIGQSTNTGVQIDDGSTNIFSKVHMEGVNTGTSPNATPTGIIISQMSASGIDNNSNKFFGCIQEICTVSLVNANSYSEFYGCEFSFPYSMVLTANPKVLVGGDPSLIPQFLPGYTYQTNSEVPSEPNTIMTTPGIYANNLQMLRQTQTSSSGGSQSSFNFNYTYDVTAVYLVTRGGYVDSSDYAMRSSYWYETVEGTFTEASTRLFDISAGSVTWTSDIVRRSATNTGYVQSQFQVSKASAVFTNWATITRVA